MADFRTVSVSSLKWFPQSRKTVPVTPVRVQTPPGSCAICLLPGRYGIELTLSGHPAHAAFVRFLASVEAHARQHARPSGQGLRWCACTDADSLVPVLRLSAFDDARLYACDGLPHADPTGFEACSCLLELAGAWVTDTAWGLRWKVLEVKQTPRMAVACMMVWDSDSDDEQRDVVCAARGPGSHQLAQQVEPAVSAGKPGHPGQAGRGEHEGDKDDGHDQQGGLVR